MENSIVLTSIPLNDLQKIIIDCVNVCLSMDKRERTEETKNDIPPDQQEEILTIKQAAEVVKLAVPTLYKLCGEKNIPHLKKGGKLLFLRKEIIKWVEEGRQKTKREIRLDAETWLGKLGQKKAINLN